MHEQSNVIYRERPETGFRDRERGMERFTTLLKFEEFTTISDEYENSNRMDLGISGVAQIAPNM